MAAEARECMEKLCALTSRHCLGQELGMISMRLEEDNIKEW